MIKRLVACRAYLYASTSALGIPKSAWGSTHGSLIAFKRPAAIAAH